MPDEILNEQQTAAYLHIDLRELRRIASRGRISCRKVGEHFRFRKIEVDHWIEVQMHTLGRERLRGIEKAVGRHHGFDLSGLLVCPLIPKGGLAVPMRARTRDSAIRELVDLADRAELVYGRDTLIEELTQRELLCSTALIPSVALPHPRHPLPYDIASSFVVVGLSAAGVPFGAADGGLTRLFFLICCKDDRTHLHVLARLSQMLHARPSVEEMLSAAGDHELAAVLIKQEHVAMKE